MLRSVTIASFGLRRLIAASATATATAPGSRPSLLLRFISGPAASPESAVRRFLPALDLTRGYAGGRRSKFIDSESDDDDIGDDGESFEIPHLDETEMSDDLGDEDPWHEPEELADDSE